MTKDEALKLALKALETLLDSFQRCEAGYPQHIEMRFAVRDTARIAIDRAKEALAQPEQKPVAWMYTSQWKGDEKFITRYQSELMTYKADKVWPLYTTPPQRKPLSDEEIILIVAECAASHQHTDIHLARAIEAAHGIKVEA